MVTYVLDTSAVNRFVDGEPGCDRVKSILRLSDDGLANACISAVNWGEVSYTIARRHSVSIAQQITARLKNHKLTIVSADENRCIRAGLLKIKYKVAYADAFGIELASDSKDHVLVTADYGVKPAEHDVNIEFLPTKPRP